MESDWYQPIFSTLFDENLKWRGSIWDSFPHSGLPWGAMWDRFFRKEFGKSGSQKLPKIENPRFVGNRFKIDVNRLNMDLGILPDRF